jgi:hypothetical protein
VEEEEKKKNGPITRIPHPACDIRTQTSSTPTNNQLIGVKNNRNIPTIKTVPSRTSRLELPTLLRILLLVCSSSSIFF